MAAVHALSARQSGAAARRLLQRLPVTAWLVVVSEGAGDAASQLHAWRVHELLKLLAGGDASFDAATLAQALDLGRQPASPVTDRWGRPAAGFVQGSGTRCVVLNETQQPVDVIECAAPAAGRFGGTTREAPMAPLAPPEIARPVAPVPASDDFQASVWLQAKAPQSMRQGGEDIVEVFIARRGPVLPGVPGLKTSASTARPVTVLLSVLGDAIEVTGPKLLRLAVPQGDQPEPGAFEIRALREGTTELAVVFRQDGRELGQLRLWVHVGALVLPRASAQAAGAPRGSAAEPPMLWLDVEPVTAGAERRYRYRVTSKALDLDHAEFLSAPLLDRDGGAAASELAFVQRTYERLSNKVLRSPLQARTFDAELRASAEDLCTQLLPAELRQLLWRERERAGTIRLMSWEPYVPWELLRLHDPGRTSDDDRYLGEHGLVRWLSGRGAVRELALDHWSYLAATYPNNPADDVVEDVAYFTQELPKRQIAPTRIPADFDALAEALEHPTYDVLHLACHGDAEQGQIDEATLYITDELVKGRVSPVGISARMLGSVARLEARRPLVFLNACAAGRMGLSLTAWGGWPRRLIDRGAGAVVGASWPVRDRASNAFATAFYDSLLDGSTLAAASLAARQASMASGDASWLAFKVFGDPLARRVQR